MTDSIFEEKFNLLIARVKALFDGAPGCHDYDHTARVLHNAEMLAAALPEADRQTVRLAALLHDIARPEEIAAKGKLGCHAQRGAAMLPGFVADLDFPAELVAQAGEAVRTHRFRDQQRPRTLEAEIVYDADKLDSLGAVGIGRAFLFAGRENARLHNAAQTAVNSPAYSREDTAYREYLVKLCKLPAAMLTVPGRRLADERACFMQEFFTRLNQETGMDDTKGVNA